MKKSDIFFEKNKSYLSRDHYDENYHSLISRFTPFLARYFNLQYEGLQNIRQLGESPCLYVVNHSAGAPQDVLLLIHMWKEEKLNPRVRGLAHQIAWSKIFGILKIPKLGAIYAHPEVAESFIKRGHSLICFPGGDVEASRTFSHRYKIDLAGRVGFIKLAKKTQLPIVPITICGTHACYINLFKVDWFGKKFRIKKMFISFELMIFFLSLIPPFWKFLPVTLLKLFIPWPSKVTIVVGTTISKETMASKTDVELYQEIQSSMQNTMNQLSARRICPWF